MRGFAVENGARDQRGLPESQRGSRRQRGKHRKGAEVLMVETADRRGDMGILASALALQESGILAHGLSVTDLSSGFHVSGVALDEDDPFIAGKDEPRFRGTDLGLKQLEILRELILEVVEQRRMEPEWSQLDTPAGRTQFPWGVGMTEPDVVVTGMHATVIADYLRCVGFRARTTDVDKALRIAAELRDVQQRIGLGTDECGVGAVGGAGAAGSGRAMGSAGVVNGVGSDGGVGSAGGTENAGGVGRVEGAGIAEGSRGADLGGSAHKRAGLFRIDGAGRDTVRPLGRDTGSGVRVSISKVPARAALAACAVLVCLVGSVWAVMSLQGLDESSGKGAGAEAGLAADSTNTGSGEDDGDNAVGEGSGADATDDAAGPDNGEPGDSAEGAPGEDSSNGTHSPWREHHLAGEEVHTAAVARADVPVALDLPGWARSGATAQREEFQSADPDMRILVSAVPTPLKSQEELDRAVLGAVANTAGIRVAGHAPVSYEEAYPDSTTLWHVRLVDGHQVSVGCQFREVTGQRLRICDAAAKASHPEKRSNKP